MSDSAPALTLFAMAEAQQGYFTVAQADEAGYLPGSRAHHVKAGNWVRVERGVYRLQRYPQSAEEQLVIYSFTIATTLLTDLLIGIGVGVAANFVMNLLMCRHAIKSAGASRMGELSLSRCVLDFFRNPVFKREYVDGVYHLYMDKPLVCFNTMQLSEELDEIPADAKAVRVHLDERVALIDHTSSENLMHVIREYSHSNVPVELVGLERMERLSGYHGCVRVANGATLPQVI